MYDSTLAPNKRRALPSDDVIVGILTDLSVANQKNHGKDEFVENKNIRLDPENIANVSPQQALHTLLITTLVLSHIVCGLPVIPIPGQSR